MTSAATDGRLELALEAGRLASAEAKASRAQVEQLIAERDAARSELEHAVAELRELEEHVSSDPRGEAGYSLTLDIINPAGATERVTWRGRSAHDGIEIAAAARTWVELMQPLGYRFPPPPIQASQKLAAAPTAAPEYRWKMSSEGSLAIEHGALVLLMPAGAAEPAEVVCPLHAATFKRREKNGESWLSHKDGAGFCRANFAKE